MEPIFLKIPISYFPEETLTDFPALIQPSKIDDWGAISLEEAQSIRIYTDEFKGQELAREVVSEDEIYVKIPELKHDEANYICVEYDGVRQDYKVDDLFGTWNVWANGYVGVYHQHGEDSSGQNNLARHTPIEKQESKIGEGYELTLGGYGFCDYNAGDIKSLSFLFKQNDVATNSVTGGQVFGDIQAGISTAGNFKYVVQAQGANFPANYGSRSYGIVSYSKDGVLNGSRSIQYGNWYHYNVNLETNDAGRLHIGNNVSSGSTYTDNVELDEIRISRIDRSANFAKTEYENLLNPYSFYGTATIIEPPTEDAERKFTPYGLTALPPKAERDPNGVYFIRTATGFELVTINKTTREPVRMDMVSYTAGNGIQISETEIKQSFQTVGEGDFVEKVEQTSNGLKVTYSDASQIVSRTVSLTQTHIENRTLVYNPLGKGAGWIYFITHLVVSPLSPGDSVDGVELRVLYGAKLIAELSGNVSDNMFIVSNPQYAVNMASGLTIQAKCTGFATVNGGLKIEFLGYYRKMF